MGRAAGIWKKLKKVASEIGSGISKAVGWANTNIFQPLKPIFSNLIDAFDPSGLGSKLFNVGTDGYHNYLESTNQLPNNDLAPITNLGKEMFEYTQDPNRFKRPFGANQQLN